MAVPTTHTRWETRRRLPLVAAAALAGALAFGLYTVLAGGSGPAVAAGNEEEPPARVEPLGDRGVNRVILSRSAARRIGVRTAPAVQTTANGRRLGAIPYAAVLYDADGRTWTYTNPHPLVFVRHDVVVASIERGVAFLTSPLPFRTRVVIVGAAELWGVEYGDIQED